MFWHDFKYSLKTLFRDRTLIFWTFIFPIILGTLFYFAFSAINDSEKLDIIKVGVVNNESYLTDAIYRPVLEQLSDPTSLERLFDLSLGTEDELSERLELGEIEGYLVLDNSWPRLVFMKNGVNQTIFKFTIEEIASTKLIVGNLVNDEVTENKSGQVDYQKIYKEALSLATKTSANLEEVPSGKLDYTMIEYYTLIAMTCLYGGILGMVAVNQKLANMSNVGKRVAVAPTRKDAVILSSKLAGYVAQLVGVALLMLYTVLILRVDYGENVWLVVLLALIGSMAGLALGVCITTLLKVSENTKTGIVIAVSMLGCFLAGMMGVTMKYVVDKNLPILNAINPANMITDGFYALYYYDSFGRYWMNVASLGIFTVILLMISGLALRRQKYDNL